jgi:hypothetical protein
VVVPFALLRRSHYTIDEMIAMLHQQLLRYLAAALALLAVTSRLAAQPENTTNPPAMTNTESYRSVFKDYRAFSTEGAGSWTEINHRLWNVGGHDESLPNNDVAPTQAEPMAPPPHADHSNH